MFLRRSRKMFRFDPAHVSTTSTWTWEVKSPTVRGQFFDKFNNSSGRRKKKSHCACLSRNPLFMSAVHDSVLGEAIKTDVRRWNRGRGWGRAWKGREREAKELQTKDYRDKYCRHNLVFLVLNPSSVWMQATSCTLIFLTLFCLMKTLS